MSSPTLSIKCYIMNSINHGVQRMFFFFSILTYNFTFLRGGWKERGGYPYVWVRRNERGILTGYMKVLIRETRVVGFVRINQTITVLTIGPSVALRSWVVKQDFHCNFLLTTFYPFYTGSSSPPLSPRPFPSSSTNRDR